METANRLKILVTKKIFPEAIALLEQHAELDYVATSEGLTPEQIVERAVGKTVLVSQITDRLNAGTIAQLKDIRMIAHIGVGYDNVDVIAATNAGIMVSNTPDVLTDTTADLAFALMLAAARRVAEGHQFVHSGQWKRWAIDFMLGVDVHHRTLGILGMGRIGQAVARRGRGFGMKVLYNNRHRLDEELEHELHAEWVPKGELLRESDFLSVHVPLSAETRHTIGEAELRMMKKGAILVNTARGPVVDEAALVRALKEGWIWGAGIDVFEREPEVHPGLLECPNAVLAPHVGSATVATRTRMTTMAAENAIAFLHGKRPPNLVN
ncbi:MAG: D-glycerate dehydrogenase [Bryobacteraceae bacterium]